MTEGKTVPFSITGLKEGIALITAMVVLVSYVFDCVYYYEIGFSILTIPISPSKIVMNAVFWVPISTAIAVSFAPLIRGFFVDFRVKGDPRKHYSIVFALGIVLAIVSLFTSEKGSMLLMPAAISTVLFCSINLICMGFEKSYKLYGRYILLASFLVLLSGFSWSSALFWANSQMDRLSGNDCVMFHDKNVFGTILRDTGEGILFVKRNTNTVLYIDHSTKEGLCTMNYRIKN